MKCRHVEPCAECPWRKDSLKGYLGGHPVELYTDAVAENEIPSCHQQDFGPDDPRSSMCAGALAVAANACIEPHKTSGAIEAKRRVGRRDDVFAHPKFFYEYHSGKAWVPRFMRMK
jgi:hypothetical protein